MKAVVVSLLFCLFLLFENATPQTAMEESPPCKKESAPSDDKLKAFIGWPYALDCGVFFKGEDYGVFDLYEYEDFDPEEEVICEIRDKNGELLLNSSSSFEQIEYSSEDAGVVILPDLQKDDNVDFNLNLRVPAVSKCFHMTIRLQLIEFQEQTCQEYITGINTAPLPSSEGSLKLFNCEVSSNVYPKLNSINDNTEMTYSWNRNCSGLPEGVATYDDDKALRIPSLTFDQGGIYTCAVEYKGMTRYLSSASVCVEHAPTFITPTFVCKQSTYYQTIGNDVVVQCRANFGTGSVSSHSFDIRWKNYQANGTNSEIYCRKSTSLNALIATKTSCTFKLPENKCFFSSPSEEDRIPTPAVVEVELVIRDVQLSDFGIFESVVRTNIEESSATKTNITVVEKYKGCNDALNPRCWIQSFLARFSIHA